MGIVQWLELLADQNARTSRSLTMSSATRATPISHRAAGTGPGPERSLAPALSRVLGQALAGIFSLHFVSPSIRIHALP
jgi:hypothetical protein